jgi:hypothetical protein
MMGFQPDSHQAAGWETETHMEYIEYGLACDDCVVAIANDDYTGMDERQERATRAALKQLAHLQIHLVVGDEVGYQYHRCNVCGGLPGNRHKVGYLE